MGTSCQGRLGKWWQDDMGVLHTAVAWLRVIGDRAGWMWVLGHHMPQTSGGPQPVNQHKPELPGA